MLEKRVLALILVLFVLLGSTYALVTPVFEASDELWHYPMIRHLADGNSLPVQVFDPAQAGPWKQEASQPPLYYYVGAALTFWIDTSDMATVRWLNPHVDNGVITEDGNVNLVVHDPQRSPWQGTLLAVRIVRLASVLMGAATVALTYYIAREVVPRRPFLALGAAAVNAFTPMFLFISGAVNNDNLAIPLASLALLLMIQNVKKHPSPTMRSAEIRAWTLLGIVIGLALLTKEGTLGLLPLALGTSFVAAWQRYYARQEPCSEDLSSAGALLKVVGQILLRASFTFAVVLVPIFLIAGWWYYRNFALYGDWLGWNAFIAVLGERSQPASLLQLWDERWGFLAAYWGLFGGVNVPMSTWIYRILNGALLIAFLGFPLYLFRRLRTWHKELGEGREGTRSLLDYIFLLIRDHFALLICLLFSAAVVVGLIRWTTTTWSSQGRLVFTAISTLTILLVLGLAGWMPPTPARVTVGAFSTFLFLSAVAAPFIWIRPTYVPPAHDVPPDIQETDIIYGDKLRLRGYHVQADGGRSLQPGDAVEVTLDWQVLEEMERDFSVFVHLNDPVLNIPIAQRDMYLGQGLMATSLVKSGQQIVNRYHLRIPETAVAPANLDLVVGLFDYYTGERLATNTGQDAVLLTEMALETRAGEFPNATSVNFGNRFELIGFAIDPRQVAAGDTVELVVHWRPLRAVQQDYTFFAQVLDGSDTTRWAHQDIGQATSTWSTGEVQTLTMPLQLREDTPAGVYRVILGVYTRDDGGAFNHLQIVREGRITMDDLLVLTKIRVD